MLDLGSGRGATSVFGDGATGGVINIVTRAPAGEATRFTTTVSGETSTAGWSEGLGGRVAQTRNRQGPDASDRRVPAGVGMGDVLAGQIGEPAR